MEFIRLMMHQRLRKDLKLYERYLYHIVIVNFKTTIFVIENLFIMFGIEFYYDKIILILIDTSEQPF